MTARVLTVKEAAERLRVNRVTVYRMCEQGRLEHFRIGTGRNIRILESVIEQWLRQAEAKADALERIDDVRDTLDRLEDDLAGQ